MKKDKIGLDDFSWGFEIEGGFKSEYFNTLTDKIKKLGVGVGKRHDGSVNGEGFKDVIDEEELNVGVFKNFNDMLIALSYFNEKAFIYNSSCGLHIHLKPKYRCIVKGVKKSIFDFSFIIELEKFGFDLCEHIKDRSGNHFCEPYFRKFKTGKYSDDEWGKEYRGLASGSKYKFMRNHPSGTLEFRFFAPCEHKIKNVKRFFKFFISKLNAVVDFKDIKEKILICGDRQELDFRLKLEKIKSPILRYTI